MPLGGAEGIGAPSRGPIAAGRMVGGLNENRTEPRKAVPPFDLLQHADNSLVAVLPTSEREALEAGGVLPDDELARQFRCVMSVMQHQATSRRQGDRCVRACSCADGMARSVRPTRRRAW